MGPSAAHTWQLTASLIRPPPHLWTAQSGAHHGCLCTGGERGEPPGTRHEIFMLLRVFFGHICSPQMTTELALGPLAWCPCSRPLPAGQLLASVCLSMISHSHFFFLPSLLICVLAPPQLAAAPPPPICSSRSQGCGPLLSEKTNHTGSEGPLLSVPGARAALCGNSASPLRLRQSLRKAVPSQGTICHSVTAALS